MVHAARWSREARLKAAVKDSHNPYSTDPARHPALKVLTVQPFNAEIPAELLTGVLWPLFTVHLSIGNCTIYWLLPHILTDLSGAMLVFPAPRELLHAVFSIPFLVFVCTLLHASELI